MSSSHTRNDELFSTVPLDAPGSGSDADAIVRPEIDDELMRRGLGEPVKPEPWKAEPRIGIKVMGARHSMARNTSIALGDHFNDFVTAQVAAGRYESVSEVVRAGLRLLEEHEARVGTLRAALEEGERSGEPQPFDFDQFVREQRVLTDR